MNVRAFARLLSVSLLVSSVAVADATAKTICLKLASDAYSQDYSGDIDINYHASGNEWRCTISGPYEPDGEYCCTDETSSSIAGSGHRLTIDPKGTGSFVLTKVEAGGKTAHRFTARFNHDLEGVGPQDGICTNSHRFKLLRVKGKARFNVAGCDDTLYSLGLED